MRKSKQIGFPRRRDGQPDTRYKEKHMVTAAGRCDRRATRTLTAGVQKRAELLFARTMPQTGNSSSQPTPAATGAPHAL